MVLYMMFEFILFVYIVYILVYSIFCSTISLKFTPECKTLMEMDLDNYLYCFYHSYFNH
jgi:hypothetical protein